MAALTPFTGQTPLLQRADNVLAQVRQVMPPTQALGGGSGLVPVVGNADLMAREQREQQTAKLVEQAFQGEQKHQDSLAGHIRQRWEEARTAKESVKQELLRCHRQRIGEYEPDLRAQIRSDGAPEVYIMLTDIKCRAVEAWLREVLLPGQDQPWDIQPTPQQDVPPDVAEAMMQEAWQVTMEEGFAFDQFQKMLKDAQAQIVKDWAETSERRAEKMKAKITDQLAEGDWEPAFSQFLTEFATYPAAFILGPQVRRKRRLRWGKGWRPEVVREAIPTWEAVSAFDVYPQPGIATPEDGYVILHSRLDRKRLTALRGIEGTNEAALARLLRDYARTGYTSWLGMDREAIDIARGHTSALDAKAGMFDVLRFFGAVPGQLLIEWGVLADHDDGLIQPDDDYEVESWLIGRDVVYCRLNPDPLGRKPLLRACAIEVPGQFWGQAIAYVMRDVQYICNAAVRALVENMSMASGPQVAMDTSALAPGETPTIKPWKVWPIAVAGNNGQLPVEFFQPQLHAAELMGVYQQFAQQSDEVTGIPAYTYGGDNPRGAGNTASGLSMLMGAASKGIRQMVGAIDLYVTRANVERLYEFNLQFDADEGIKGDVRVLAAGAVAIMQKETLRMRKIEFLSLTNNPIDMSIIGEDGRAEVLRSVADSLEMNTERVVPPREEMIQRRQQREQQEQAMAMAQQMLGGMPPGGPGGPPPGPQQQTPAGDPAGGTSANVAGGVAA